MTDQIPDFLDDFDEGAEPPELPSTRRKNLADPLFQLPSTEVRRAINPQGKDPSMAGKQLRRGVLLPPEMDEEINRLVKEYRIGKMALMRYLIAAGLERIHTNGLEQDMIEKRSFELHMPEWRRNES
jgi:hypothetical protein